MSNISLKNVLPRVFAGSERELPVKDSQVWLRELDFTAPNSYLIEAESGTGKSSLCSYIYGNRHDYSGEILFDGENIRTFSISQWCELRTRAIALLPQEMRLFPELTVKENILIKNRLTDFKTESEILEMLRRLEISEKTNQLVSRLSVGQQQRVAIVRALCQPFDFLILDEPVSHLDERNNTIVSSLIADEVKSQSASIIATSVGNKISLPFSIQISL
ncbi:MAG: ATP-binding cassette domain-containing protein [Muribaculaceae bacterium]|nr:ATP-binding cassette domain-containing protein [Muribaculaceae bacterium]MBQ3606281.1 ATP-binding cassette domain-containing protein [Muribaculaceae bacterium]